MTTRISLLPLIQGLTIGFLGVGGLLSALTAGPASGTVMAVFPPWWDGHRAVSAAAEGGAVLRLGAVASIVLVSLDGAESRGRLRRAGAWLLMDPAGLTGCRPKIKGK